MLEQSNTTQLSDKKSSNQTQSTALLHEWQASAEKSQIKPASDQITGNHNKYTSQEIQPVSARNATVPATAPDTSNWSDALQTTLDHPPAALPRYMILVGFLFACMFGTWAWFGTMQEVSQAQGQLLPEGDTYKIQPIVTGEISKIWVKEGDTIQSGQVAIELDTEVLESEVERLSQSLKALTTQLQKTQVLIAQTQYEAAAQQTIADAEIQTQEAAIIESQANISTNQDLVFQLTTDLEANQVRLERLGSLLDEGAISKEYLFDVEQTLRDRHRAMTERQGQVQQALAQSEQLNAQLDLRRAEATKRELEAQEKLKRLQIEADDLEAKLAETNTLLKAAQTNLDQMFLYAPVNGTVASVNISNIGEIIQPGQTIIEIAPAETPLVLSALIPNREVGLVETGMPVQMKFDAFPYQQYGIVSGKVTSISPDSKLDETMGAVYEVEIALNRDHVIHEKKVIPLKAGQTASAEIVIRKRRVIDFLLDPIRQLKEGSLNV
ncbi:HlyD family type I secretion periplasmic adaptor subunit [Leptothoe spongobia]|uniref:HlyD family type I secretion periplasmic adaptor subunit n=1 Tax=Leptothoe spongobia TAU-MAC 1115 TaxID=1967444 RepID=A0A947DCE2_9CYAN|nr:HlyD family type I secretion periplasmic adaptor subunit [Leptothoe spongobia]MBT9314462.1 HlyD family type I secretion periplasmic adaptor subunit [Leptothoe spongobia TAU-MAC 1115]